MVEATGIGRDLDLDPKTLGFDDSVEIATAAYKVDGKMARLVLLLYPTQQLAKKYMDQWEAASPDESSWRKRVGALVAMVRGSRDETTVKAILDRVNY